MNALYKKNKKSTYARVCIAVFYILYMLTGVIPDTLRVVALFLVVCLMVPKREFVLLLPATVIYYSYADIPIIGLSLYRVYSLLLFEKIILQSIKNKLTIDKSRLFILAPILIYSIIMVTSINIRTGVFLIVDLLLFLLVVSYYHYRDYETFKTLLGLFAIACAMSVVTGRILQTGISLSYQIGDKWRATTRFMGTFQDPNYCCMLYLFSIFVCLCLKPFKRWINLLLIVTLSIGIAMTISFSGYIGTILILMLYMIMFKKIKPKTLLVILIICCFLIALYNYGNKNSDTPILGDISYRIRSYLLDYEISGADSLSLKRVNIWQGVYAKYSQQSVLKQIFGMNDEVPILNSGAKSYTAAHNDYMDMLYNLGFILTFVFYTALLWRTLRAYLFYQKTKDDRQKFIIISKILWLYYSLVLTMVSERVFFLVLLV